MNASHAFNRTDAGAFGKSGDYRDLLIRVEYVRHKALYVITVPQKLYPVNVFVGYNYRIMLNHLAILAVFLSVAQASAPIPRVAADPKSRGSQSEKADTHKSQNPPLSSVGIPKATEAPALKDNPKYESAKDGWDKAGILSNYLLVIVGIGGIYIAIRTLVKLREQTKATQDAAVAAKTSAETSLAQIQLIKDKERVRLFIDIEPWLLRDGLSRPLDNLVLYPIKWRVRIFGQTDALEVKAQIFACVGDPREYELFREGFGSIFLPSIIRPGDDEMSGEIHIYPQAANGESVCDYEMMAVRDKSITVYCAANLEFSDVFGEKWIVSFNKRWVPYTTVKGWLQEFVSVSSPSGFWGDIEKTHERKAN